MLSFTDEQRAFLENQRVGHLASASFNAAPHVVPVCYACDGERLYIALDSKPKRVAPAQLRRVRNILENPQVALVVDRYSENWETLAYVLIEGRATLLPATNPAHSRAIGLLRQRYAQYLSMPIEQQPVIVIEPVKIVGWGALIMM